MEQQKKCVVCGKWFLAKRKDSVCCSYVCGKKRANEKHKDKSRHGDKRIALISNNGFVCSACGVQGNSFDIVAHHTTFDNQEHNFQVLLCRSCHAKLHSVGRTLKPIGKDAMIEALESSETTQEAAAKLGISKATMYQKRKMYGLRITKERKHISYEQFKNALENTRSTKDAMTVLGIASLETFFRKKRMFGFMQPCVAAGKHQKPAPTLTGKGRCDSFR
jgi:hypothetical protein